MDREYLIQKWLNHALNAEELKAFQKLEDYEALMMLDKNLQQFEAPGFDEKESLNHITKHLETRKKSTNWLKPLLRVAAIVVIAIGSFWFLNQNTDTTISTLVSEKTNISLPDNSEVFLNTFSNLVYNERTWEKNRAISLEGEAFFKVAKGSSFNVKTSKGTVTVLGTQFNVKQRGDYFEVVCYEGLVQVLYNQKETKLHPGNRIIIISDALFLENKEVAKLPSWTQHESTFKSLPYKYVLEEFERQYDVSFNTKNIDVNEIFTGSFTHKNYQVAIKSITLPLHVTYSKNQKTITLKRE